mgnify:CR=1 FL=1
MDNEKLKQFGIPLLILLATVVALVMLVPKVSTNITEYQRTKSEIADKTTQLQQKQEQLEAAKREKEAEKKAQKNNKATALKPFYKAIDSGLDTEAILAGEFAEILQLIRANKIKVRSIKYDYNPEDDNFIKGDRNKYKVARLNTEMIGNYKDYDNFLKELYKHEHFIDIQSVEIVPYRKNKKILLINFKLKLYAQN